MNESTEPMQNSPEQNQSEQKKQNSSSDSNDVIWVSRDQLPLSCPMPDGDLWNMHPRVFLEIEKTGRIQCPYCGAHYHLKE